MAQHDFNIANQTFPNTRIDINNAWAAIVSQSSGATAPSTTYAYQFWYDTTTDLLKIRNADNDAWISIFAFNQTTDSVTLEPNASGDIVLGNVTIDADQTIGAGQDNFVLTYDNATGKVSLEAAAGGDVVDDLTPQLGGNLSTNGNDITFGDNDKAVFGAGSDLQIFHDGSNSFIDDAGTGVLGIRSNSISLGKYTGENLASFVADGAVTLYYDNAAKIATTATGVSVTGTLAATAVTGDGSGLTNLPSGGGKVLQVLSTTKTNIASFSSSSTNTFVDIPDMSVTITPTSTSSKILVFFTANVSQSTTATTHVRLVRGSTPIYVGDSAGSRLQDSAILRTASSPYALEIGNLQGTFLDSPATTSATVYKLQGVLGASYSGTFYLNRSPLDSNADFGGRTASSITVMEIAQ